MTLEEDLRTLCAPKLVGPLTEADEVPAVTAYGAAEPRSERAPTAGIDRYALAREVYRLLQKEALIEGERRSVRRSW